MVGTRGERFRRTQEKTMTKISHKTKTITTFAMLVAMVSLGGCGGKKPQAAAPEETADDDDDKVSTDPKTPDEVEAPDETAPAATASLNDVIYFEFDAADLSEASRATLNENADWLREDPTRTLTIEGHTDEVGTAEYNLGLGERRARTTRDYLVNLGIDEKRVKIITYGEERPSGGGDAQNRRSMFIATKK
jgi:peptidoglycan-associated lipoprotein